MRHCPLTYLLIALLGVCVQCKKDKNGPDVARPAVGSLRFIGQVAVPHNYEFRRSTVGGLSSITYRPGDSTWHLMCDDPSNLQAARFYQAALDLDATGFRSVNFLHVITLKRPDGTAFPSAATDRTGIIDPEGLVYNPATGTFYWSSEGERLPENNPPVLVQPFIREMNADGEHMAEFVLPELFRVKATGNGPRRNGVFEGLTLSPDGKYLFASLEEPLYEDGPRADPSRNGTLVRILKFDVASRNVVAQYAYPLDKVHAAPNPADQFVLNGVAEITAASDNKLLVMERSFASGATPEFSVRIYEADLAAATDVTGLTALSGTGYSPTPKQLVMDVVNTGITRVDNLEGMTFGPALPNGNRTLVLVSDNNFNPLQMTQFLAFEVIN